MNTRIDTLQQHMLSVILSVFDAYTVALFLPDRAEDGEPVEYQLAAYDSLGDRLLPDTRIKAGQGLVGWIIANKKPLEVPQFNQDQGHGHLLYYAGGEEETIKAFMGCPLPGGGALCVDTKRQYSFSDRELKHLHMFASILSGLHSLSSHDEEAGNIPLYFARLESLDELRIHYKNWDSYISSFLNIVADVTEFDYCAFVSVEVPGESYSINAENQPVLVRSREPFYQSISSGLAGWVLRNGQSVIHTGEDGRAPALFGMSENLPAFAAVAVFPVNICKSTRACLCLGHNRVHPIGETMRTFLREAVGLLALHAENLYLRLRLRSTMERARVYTSGPRAHNPNTEPYQPVMTDKED